MPKSATSNQKKSKKGWSAATIKQIKHSCRQHHSPILQYPGKYRAGNVVPHGEDRSGDGRHGHVREGGAGERGCKAGVLHANLDGDCFFAGEVHLEEDGDQVAAQISEQVVKDHDGEDDEAGGQYFGAVVGDDGCDDEADGGH